MRKNIVQLTFWWKFYNYKVKIDWFPLTLNYYKCGAILGAMEKRKDVWRNATNVYIWIIWCDEGECWLIFWWEIVWIKRRKYISATVYTKYMYIYMYIRTVCWGAFAYAREYKYICCNNYICLETLLWHDVTMKWYIFGINRKNILIFF